MDDEEYGPPPSNTALRRAPSHATPTTLNEPRLMDDEEYEHYFHPPCAIARHAGHAQRAAPHGRRGVRASRRLRLLSLLGHMRGVGVGLEAVGGALGCKLRCACYCSCVFGCCWH